MRRPSTAGGCLCARGVCGRAARAPAQVRGACVRPGWRTRRWAGAGAASALVVARTTYKILLILLII